MVDGLGRWSLIAVQVAEGQFNMVQAGERRSQHAHTMCHSSASRDSTHDLLGCLIEERDIDTDDCVAGSLEPLFSH